VIAELFEGMKFIHSRAFIHRDLKPTNILVDDEHNIKISDFGQVEFMKLHFSGENNSERVIRPERNFSVGY
jgi:serine/threonine protein kinase